MWRKKEITANPYVEGEEGRKEWNDRYFVMSKQIRHWQIAFIVLSSITLVLSYIIVNMTRQSRIQPVVVEMCNSELKGILPVSNYLPEQDKLIKYALNQYIINTRTVITDAEAQKYMLNKTYAYSSGPTIDFLRDHYQKNNPFELANTATIQPIITDIFKISPYSWQITWEETKKNSRMNEIISKTRWIATVTVKLGEVNSKFINENPFGIYVQQISWAETGNHQS